MMQIKYYDCPNCSGHILKERETPTRMISE